MTYVRIEQLLTHLIETTGNTLSFVKDETERFRLSVPPSSEIIVVDAEADLFLFSRITPIPPHDNREALLIHLMKANLLGQGTGGAVLGIDREDKHFTLSLTLPSTIDHTTFKEAVEEFANYISYWKDEIDGFVARGLANR
ncbi:MAG: type III secretion system chaperone [Simkaniaceae bacterium]|nr:type III secretion system chaperone [Simkaniaceae bacterium]